MTGPEIDVALAERLKSQGMTWAKVAKVLSENRLYSSDFSVGAVAGAVCKARKARKADGG